MDDYISRKTAIDEFDGVKVDEENCTEYDIGYNDGIDFAVSGLSVLPSADVQQVVRCKDCRHRYLDKKYGFRCDLDTGDPFEEGRSAENDDWFCADGIKMNGEQMRRR